MRCSLKKKEKDKTVGTMLNKRTIEAIQISSHASRRSSREVLCGWQYVSEVLCFYFKDRVISASLPHIASFNHLHRSSTVIVERSTCIIAFDCCLAFLYSDARLDCTAVLKLDPLLSLAEPLCSYTAASESACLEEPGK